MLEDLSVEGEDTDEKLVGLQVHHLNLPEYLEGSSYEFIDKY
jgi:hypothetical protein